MRRAWSDLFAFREWLVMNKAKIDSHDLEVSRIEAEVKGELDGEEV